MGSHFFTQSLSQSGFFKSASPAYLFLLHHPKLFQYSSEWSHTIPYGPIQFLIAPYSPLWSHTVLYSPMKSLTVTYSLIKSHTVSFSYSNIIAGGITVITL